MCACMCVHVHAYVCVYVYAYVCVYVYIYTYLPMRGQPYSYVGVWFPGLIQFLTESVDVFIN